MTALILKRRAFPAWGFSGTQAKNGVWHNCVSIEQDELVRKEDELVRKEDELVRKEDELVRKEDELPFR